MTYSAKSCIIAWWVTVSIAVLIWYRNILYDRLFASILIVLGMLQLVSYGCHSSMDPMKAGMMISLLLTFLLFTISIGTYLYTHILISLLFSIVTSILLILEIYSIMFSNNIYMAYIPSLACTETSGTEHSVGMYPIWTVNGKSIIDGLGYVFLLIVTVSWLCLLYHLGWDDIGLYIIAIYVVATLMYSLFTSEDLSIGPYWCYLLTGLVIVIWFIGFFGDDPKINNR